MTIGVQPEATRLDSDRINDVIVNGGIARKAAVHQDNLASGAQSWRQWIREDKTPLRTVMDPDSSRYRSQFGYKFKDQQIPFIVDGLSYGKFALDRINMGQIPFDRQQSDLAMYFMQAEDRLFFAGDPLVPTGGSSGLANESANPVTGTHFSLTAATQLDLFTDAVMTTTLAAMIGQQLDHFKDAVMDYSLILAVSPDVDDWINGYKNTTTGQRMKPEILSILAENGNGGAAILRTSWLGATVDAGNGNLPYKVTDGLTNAALMMWSETNPLYEVLSTGLLIDGGVDEVGRYNSNFTEGYLPVSYDPFSIVYSNAVDLVA